MLHTSTPFAFVLISIAPSVHPVAFSLAVFPLSYVRITQSEGGISSLPNSIAVPQPFGPLAFVNLIGCLPMIASFAMSLTVLKLALIHITVWISLIATTMSLVMLPLTLKDSPVIIAHYTLALPDKLTVGLPNTFSEKYCIRKLLNEEIF